jgi:hypothetical protein
VVERQKTWPTRRTSTVDLIQKDARPITARYQGCVGIWNDYARRKMADARR